jgi:hypothetical protein
MHRTRAWDRRIPRRALAIDLASALLVPQPSTGGNEVIAGEFDAAVVGAGNAGICAALIRPRAAAVKWSRLSPAAGSCRREHLTVAHG